MLKFYKRNKFLYYFTNTCLLLIPNYFFRKKLKQYLNDISDNNKKYVLRRVNYYNKLEIIKPIKNNGIKLSNLKLKKKGKVYFFDSYKIMRYFNKDLRANFVFGDVTFIPEIPSFVKSRPINNKNENSILLKLNEVRHYNFINDPYNYDNKLDKFVWRGHFSPKKENRFDFLKKFHDKNYLCNVGSTTYIKDYSHFKKKYMSIKEQLKYKFIICLEGNDVATSLQWVMSSNSIAVMPKPKYETWFMEGTLIPDYHYVKILNDYSDLEEKINYYLQNPNKAKNIVNNANKYVKQFKNKKQELLISLLTAKKYFIKTNQIIFID
jgi:hypothetical protein